MCISFCSVLKDFPFMFLYTVCALRKCKFPHILTIAGRTQLGNSLFHAYSNAALLSISSRPPSAAQTKHNYSIKLSLSAGHLSLIGIHSCPLHIWSLAKGHRAATRWTMLLSAVSYWEPSKSSFAAEAKQIEKFVHADIKFSMNEVTDQNFFNIFESTTVSMFNQLAGSSAGQRGCGECWVCRVFSVAGRMSETSPRSGMSEKCSGWLEQQALSHPSQGLLVAPHNSQEKSRRGLNLARDLCSSVSSWCNEIVVVQEHGAWLTGGTQPRPTLPVWGEQSKKERLAGGFHVVGDKLLSLMQSVVCLGSQRVASVMSFWPLQSSRGPRDFV